MQKVLQAIMSINLRLTLTVEKFPSINLKNQDKIDKPMWWWLRIGFSILARYFFKKTSFYGCFIKKKKFFFFTIDQPLKIIHNTMLNSTKTKACPIFVLKCHFLFFC